MSRQRIVLAEDHVLIRDAIRKLLEPEFDVVGSVSDGRSLMAAVQQLQPALVVLDLSLPLLNGVAAGRQLVKLITNMKLLIVTMNEDPQVAMSALDGWADGYVLKKSVSSELIHAVREVLAGRRYMTPKIAAGAALFDVAV